MYCGRYLWRLSVTALHKGQHSMFPQRILPTNYLMWCKDHYEWQPVTATVRQYLCRHKLGKL